MSAKGLILAAPTSGAGKTTLTLALLNAMKSCGIGVSSAKVGPDYIDPAFHAAASGRVCVNLDGFAMRPDLLRELAARQADRAELLVIEGVMGLFDGAADGTGSTADLAALLKLPVVLAVDAAKQSQSVAALVRGFRDHRSDVTVAGVILNRIGSPRHREMIERALGDIGMPVLGAVPRSDALTLPERHLGLVQAGEHGDLAAFLDGAAEHVAGHVDLDALTKIARPVVHADAASKLPPLGQRIAIARDTAFAFSYPHMLDGWREQGAEFSFFSPLSDEAPDGTADAIFLPGGYPELHAGKLAAVSNFKAGMKLAAERGALIYGECGGYMTLGQTLIDAEGIAHEMLDLLPLVTSFRKRKLHLGYRKLTPFADLPFGMELTAHEFHYASIVSEGGAERLFSARDALGEDLPAMGLREDRVMGSFAHVIDRV
ncbi:cobyrinate a,c-diamide synthase [Rhizobiales bacterium]|uniref:cobyrinate a,c-diamide synthase n=1 Tax=Hongsoonwoonella zoysiae TaxID=2821844 RepID=UPI00155FD0BB|nr:cobyrinate a,c-diamide synthase [Hongsoonwoonella zoysiae]NRG16364.1 cobyrinate a,c-diamide synthase [Hongsoonwoonella zoysiae]